MENDRWDAVEHVSIRTHIDIGCLLDTRNPEERAYSMHWYRSYPLVREGCFHSRLRARNLGWLSVAAGLAALVQPRQRRRTAFTGMIWRSR